MKIAIQIIDADGNPVSGATVDIFDGATEVAGNQRSNAEGRISISNQAPAAGRAIKFIVTKEGFKKLEQVEHPTDDSLNVTLRFPGDRPIPPPINGNGKWTKVAIGIGAALVAIIVIIWIKFNHGPATLPVPELLGVPGNIVSVVFKDSGFKFEQAGHITTSDQEPGNVARQDPPNGRMPRGSVIKYWVADKPPQPAGPPFAGSWANENRSGLDPSSLTISMGNDREYVVHMLRGTNKFGPQAGQVSGERLKVMWNGPIAYDQTFELLSDGRLRLEEITTLRGKPPQNATHYFRRFRSQRRVPLQPRSTSPFTNK